MWGAGYVAVQVFWWQLQPDRGEAGGSVAVHFCTRALEVFPGHAAWTFPSAFPAICELINV